MFKFKQTILMLCLFFSGALCYAHGEVKTTEKEEGVPIAVKQAATSTGLSKGDSINASIDGHTLSIVFLENLGQVTIDVSLASGGEVETQSTPTPNGVNIYIASTGSYVVTFTLSNGDEYYGEFEVTD